MAKQTKKKTSRSKNSQNSNPLLSIEALAVFLIVYCLLAIFQLGFLGKFFANVIRFFIGDLFVFGGVCGILAGFGMLFRGRMPKIIWRWTVAAVCSSIALLLFVSVMTYSSFTSSGSPLFQEMMNRFENDRIHVAGRRYLLNYFDHHANVDHLKGIYQLMDDQTKLHRLVTNENQDIQQKIIYLLGEKAYENGVYNRSFVANCVFNNNELLQKLNEIIHPAVRQDFLDFVDRQNSQFIFKETAILFELGLDKDCDEVILVTANTEMRIERVMVRDGRTRQEIEQIIAKQMPENEKIQISDYVIYNNQNDFSELEHTVDFILKFILQNNV